MRWTPLLTLAILLALGSYVAGQTKTTTTKKPTTTKTTTTKKPTTPKTTTTKKPTTPKTTTTKKPTTTKPPQCNKQNFDSMKSCCSGSVGRFFTDSEITICTKGLTDQKLLQFTNFRFNIFYDNLNSLVLDSVANLKQLGPVPTVNECLFRLKNLIDENNNILYDSFIPLVEKASTANWIAAGAPPAINSSFNSTSLAAEMVNLCKPVVEAMIPAQMTVQFNRTAKVTSLARPFYLTQCMKKTVLDSCPPTLAKKNDANCAKSASILRTCGYFNTTVTYNA